MSRFSPGRAYNHRIQRLTPDDYILSWTVDRYFRGSRLRFPRRFKRFTDRAGAVRFAVRHSLRFEEAP